MDATTPALRITAGTTLPNGATVIAASMRNANQWIILAMHNKGDFPEYVTWKCPRPTTDAATPSP